jgi:hypothetical protein
MKKHKSKSNVKKKKNNKSLKIVWRGNGDQTITPRTNYKPEIIKTY